MFKGRHLFLKRSCCQDLKKGCDEKDVKSKGGSQGLCRNAVDHIKILIMMTQATIHGCNFFTARVFWLG